MPRTCTNSSHILATRRTAQAPHPRLHPRDSAPFAKNFPKFPRGIPRSREFHLRRARTNDLQPRPQPQKADRAKTRIRLRSAQSPYPLCRDSHLGTQCTGIPIPAERPRAKKLQRSRRHEKACSPQRTFRNSPFVIRNSQIVPHRVTT